MAMLNLGIPLQITQAGAGASGGSKWYAPLKGKPTTLPVATGSDALAAGNGASATGFRAIGFGYGATASFTFTTSIGYAPNASAFSCVAIGQQANASNDFGVAIGTQANAAYQYCVAIGYGALTNGNESIAIGRDNVAQTSAIVIGRSANGALNSIVLGYQATAQYATYGVAIGYQAAATTTYAVAIGANSTAGFVGSVAWAFSSPYNDYEHQIKRVGGGRRMVCQNGGTSTDVGPDVIGSFIIPNSSACGFTGVVSAYRTVTTGGGTVGDSATWIVTGLVKDVSGTLTIVGATLGTGGAPSFNDAGAAGWTIATAVNGFAIEILATGQAGETIKWETSIQFTTTG